MAKQILSMATLVLFFFIIGCKQKDPESYNAMQETTIEPQAVALSTFDSLPPIDGCSCFYAIDTALMNKQKFIFGQTYSGVAYVQIDGVQIQFKLVETKKIDERSTVYSYESDAYKIFVTSTSGQQTGDELWHSIAVLAISAKDGTKASTVQLVGNCGC